MMKLKSKGNLKKMAGAVGCLLAFAAAPSFAGITWNLNGLTLFEDDDVDFHYVPDGAGGLVLDNVSDLDIGSVIIAVLELNTSAGVSILPDELTGVAAVQLAAIDPTTGALLFAPYVDGYNAAIEAVGGPADILADDTGAMVAFWLDDSPDLVIDAGSILAGNYSCSTAAQCIGQASDGSLWQVDGFAGDPDELWVEATGQTSVSTVRAGSTSQDFAAVNISLSILFEDTGVDIQYGSIACNQFCGPGGNGLVDMTASGSIKGGGFNETGGNIGEWFATSDFDLIKRAAVVPEPGTIVLFAAGLIGLGLRGKKRGRV